MKANAPTGRRKFVDEWDEIGYLYDKLLFWLYQRQDKGKARSYADRLEPLLRKAAPDHQAIRGEECWSLIYESRGNLRKAVQHRENEIRLIHRLHEAAHDSPHSEVLLRGYGFADLSDRLDLLATLYHDSGDLDRAIETLDESRRLCDAHGIDFDGEDLLREYRSEEPRSVR
ncbi:MAG: hypothetical protein HY000_36960 [Planctomycetes bacterium]|nr:hypothetical protein [Planctomycetota bacterium]